MPVSASGLAFENADEPTVVVVGQAFEAGNQAWRALISGELSIREFFHPDDHEAVLRAFEAARATKAKVTARVRVSSLAGSPQRFALWSLGEGAVALRCDGPADAPETMEEMIRSKERALAWVFERIDAVLWAIRKDGTITLSEGNGLARHGMKNGQMVGVNAFEAFPPGSDPLVGFQRTIAGESVHDMPADEAILWNRFMLPVPDEDGEPMAMLGFSSGVSTQIERVRQAEKLLSVINELPIVVWAMDRDGTCTLSMGQRLDTWGLKSGELVGTNLFELYAGNSEYINNFQRCLAGESLSSESQHGDTLFYSQYIPAKDIFGQISGILAVVQDITQQRRAEEQVREQRAVIVDQTRAIAELVSPIIEVWQGILVIPIIGVLAEDRAAALTEKLLPAVVSRGAGFTILDLTGVDTLDTATVDHLINIMRAVELLGAKCLLSGIRSNVARTMATLDIKVSARAYPTLAAALRACMVKATRGERQRGDAR